MKKVTKWLDGLHAVVIGPGLGRDPVLWEDIKTFLKAVKDTGLPLVIDGVFISFFFLLFFFFVFWRVVIFPLQHH
jgi:NAD(P)H-hydrate repair Nnr-like enzyme with NAD(P)H-hydrate dehydratase domain